MGSYAIGIMPRDGRNVFRTRQRKEVEGYRSKIGRDSLSRVCLGCEEVIAACIDGNLATELIEKWRGELYFSNQQNLACSCMFHRGVPGSWAHATLDVLK